MIPATAREGGRLAGYDAPVADGRVLQVNVSTGGVPKLPVPSARVTRMGLDGDRQRDETVHGGPHRAVSILGIEAIRRVAAEGHPIGPGTTGENLTTEGFDVSLLPTGTRLEIGDDVVLELLAPANPCRTIRHSFRDLRFGRLGVAAHPADSRVYARVVVEGIVAAGDDIRIRPPAGPEAEDLVLAARLDDAERSSTLSVWRAARAAGMEVAIIDDGELAISAAPDLPGPVFNQGLGFASLPHLVPRAVEHFRAHRTTGWVWADGPPWPNAEADATAVSAVADPRAIDGVELPGGVTVREIARDEIGPWADVVATSAGLAPAVAAAWRALERPFALGAHDRRFVAEEGGRVVGAGALHVRRRVGWLRAGAVLPSHRGRGIQRALIVARARAAASLGAELVGASANDGGPSAANLDRLGFRVVARRARYRVDAA